MAKKRTPKQFAEHCQRYFYIKVDQTLRNIAEDIEILSIDEEVIEFQYKDIRNNNIINKGKIIIDVFL